MQIKLKISNFSLYTLDKIIGGCIFAMLFDYLLLMVTLPLA